MFNTDPNLAGELTSVRVASGLLRPLFVASPPGDLDRLFIVQQDGLIRILEDGALLPDPFLDVSAITLSPGDAGGGNEQGLLGLAFHPDYASNGQFFIFHTNSTGSFEVLARFERDAGDPDLADASTRTVVLNVPSANANHNGGMIAFSPIDGHLYIATGDGGGGCDSPGNGQNINTLNGSLLRLDVDALPASTAGNPFDGGTPGADEIWAYGLRNPYRFSIDRATGAIYIGDVGQGVWEEIDCQPPGSSGGENYGWNHYEGPSCPNDSCGDEGTCSLPGYVPPIRYYDQAGTPCAVTGGYVYRGCRMPDLHGTYFYADFCAAWVRSFRTNASCAVTAEPDLDRTTDLERSGALSIDQITSFGEDEQGELYVVDRGGEVFKILPVLPIMEVSGPNAQPFELTDGGDWTFEDLAASSGHAIDEYRVYRSGSPTGPFSCVRRVVVPTWVGGDLAVPASGQVFYYLVQGRGPAGQTTLGAQSDGTVRSVVLTGLCL